MYLYSIIEFISVENNLWQETVTKLKVFFVFEKCESSIYSENETNY